MYKVIKTKVCDGRSHNWPAAINTVVYTGNDINAAFRALELQFKGLGECCSICKYELKEV